MMRLKLSCPQTNRLNASHGRTRGKTALRRRILLLELLANFSDQLVAASMDVQVPVEPGANPSHLMMDWTTD
jgi:hypothetical protein